MNESSDGPGLLAALAAGDATAWTNVVQRHGGLLRHICRQHRLGAEQTDDVLQNTWITLLRYGGGIHNPDALGAWLATTTRRECLVQCRRQAREIPSDEGAFDFSGPDLTPETDERLDAFRHRGRLRRAIALLPPRERALIGLLLETDLPSYAEISRRLGMPIGAIGPVRKRALGRLRKHLGQGTPVVSTAFA